MTETATTSTQITVTLTLETVMEMYQAIQAIDTGYEDVIVTEKGEEKIRRRYRITDRAVYYLGVNHSKLRKHVKALQAGLNNIVDELSNGLGTIFREITKTDGSKDVNPLAVEFDRRRNDLLAQTVDVDLRTIAMNDIVLDGDRCVPATVISALSPIILTDDTNE